MVRLVIPYAINTAVMGMLVTTAIIAHIIIMGTIMSAAIRAIVIWAGEIKMITIGISDVNPERPASATDIHRTVEVGSLHEAVVLLAVHHPTEIVVAHIQVVVVAVQSPLLTTKYVIHQVAYAGNKVIVYFVHIIILLCIELQFVSHLVREEKSFFAHFAVTHCRTANSGTHHSGYKYK